MYNISGFRSRIIRQLATILVLMYVGILVIKQNNNQKCNDAYVVKRHKELSLLLTDSQPKVPLVRKNIGILSTKVLTTSKKKKSDLTANQDRKNVTLKPVISISLGCKDVDKLIADLENERTSIHRKENDVGNRAVYYTTISDVDGHVVNVVIKVANLYNESSETEQYRYNSAFREIKNLQKLELLGFVGSPQLLLSCVTFNQVVYIVTRVRNGVPICTGDANDKKCSMAYDVMENIKSRPDSALMAITWIAKVISFFAQFEKHNIFVEDISGSNFFYNHENFDITIVDADSLLFYNEVPLFSRLSCRRDTDCPKPGGNLWGPNALNHKIYYSCRERDGYCVNNTCHGFDSNLHTCGIGRWLVIPVRGLIPDKYYNKFREIMHCMTVATPNRRCTLAFASAQAKLLLQEIENER